ncbi:MAG: PP0621 family protein [Hylemonella sp.]|jgi:uncharacterized protein|uniref:PP0621 family protein n=1 Tax=Hylemonella sp. TaxID=2066020 RepID=UPI00391C4A5B
MKFLFLLAIVLLLVWLWRSSRRQASSSDQPDPPTTPPGPQEMVRCAHCGVHLPHGDAIVGRIGLYCSREHQQLAEP